MTLSSSDEETSDDKKDENDASENREKDRLPKPDISQPKKKTDEEIEDNNSEGGFKNLKFTQKQISFNPFQRGSTA